MPPKNRSEKLLIILPATLAIACYSLLVNTGAQRDLQTAEAKLVAARAEFVKPLDVLEQKARLAQLTREIEQLEPRKRQLVGRAKFFCGLGEQTTSHVAAVEHLTQLGAKYELRLIGESTVSAGSQQHHAKLPKSLDAATKRVAEHGGTPAVMLWRIEFVGGYFSVLKLLRELSRDDSTIVPVNLSLAKAELGNPVRQWTLIVLVGVADEQIAAAETESGGVKAARRESPGVSRSKFIRRGGDARPQLGVFSPRRMNFERLTHVGRISHA